MKAQSTGLSVGFAVNPPWVTDEDTAAGGIEGELIRRFAESEGMRIVWEKGSEQTLMQKLKERKLHIVIAGFSLRDRINNMNRRIYDVTITLLKSL